MDKQTIEFLLKAGYNLSEIMTMNSVTEPPKSEDNTPEQITIEENVTEPSTAENNAEKLSEQLEALRKELSELREITHNANRRNAVIDNPTPAPTIEEQVEQLMKEVGN